MPEPQHTAEAQREEAAQRQSPLKHAPYAPLPLGARFVQLYFVVMLLLPLINAALVNPGEFTYDLSLLCSVLVCGNSTVAVWIIQVRSNRAANFALAAFVIMNVTLLLDIVFCGGADVVAAQMGWPGLWCALAAEFFFGLAAVVYLRTSAPARAALNCDYRYAEAPLGQTWDVPLLKRLRSWTFWRDILIYFVIFSFLGHWVEMAFCQLIRLGVVMGEYDPSNAMLWDQWLYPFSAEGIAVALIVLLLHPLSRWLLKKSGGRMIVALPLSIIAIGLVCTSIDFTLGITCNADYHLWDYSNMPFNFMGQICLQNSVTYTTAATLIVWIFYPLMDKGMRKIPTIVLDGIFWFLAGFYGFCALLHFMYLGPAGFIFG